MPITLLDQRNDAIGSGTTVAVVMPTTAIGNALLVGVFWFDPGSAFNLTSITCSGEANPTLAGPRLTHSDGRAMQYAIIPALVGGGSKTVTATFSGSVFHMVIMGLCLAGVHTTTPTNVVNGASAASGAPTVSVTTTAAGCAVVSMLHMSTADITTITQPAGHTKYDLLQTSGGCDASYLLDAGAAGAKSCNWTLSYTGTIYVVNAIAIAPGAGGGGSSPGGLTPDSGLSFVQGLAPDVGLSVNTGISR